MWMLQWLNAWRILIKYTYSIEYIGLPNFNLARINSLI